MKIRTAVAAASLAAVLSACGGGNDNVVITPTPSPATPLELTILHVNDQHSHLDAESVDLKLETAPGKREAITVEYGGYARVVAAFKALSPSSANVIKINAGDAISGDLYYTLTDGKADAELMNQVCFDTFTLGNHEFDNGDSGLKTFIDFLHASSCKTKVLSANVTFGANSVLNPAKAPGYVLPSTVIERAGQKIGLIGLTIAGKTKNASRPDADTTFADEAGMAQAEIDRLKAQGINKIVLQTHLGYAADQALVKRLSGVDVIVGGDSHSLLGPDTLKDYGLSPEGAYPTRNTDKDGKPVCIVQAWQYSYVVGELKIGFDANGEVSKCEGTPHVLVGDSFKRKDSKAAALSAAEIAAIRADIATGKTLRPTTPDADATAALAGYKKQKDDFGARQVATADATLCLRRVPGTKRDSTRSPLGDICNKDAHVNAYGGDIQQIVAEAFLQQGKRFFNADIAIQNGGGVRTDIKQGPVSVKDIYTVLPFKNTLVQLKASGAEIKAALEDAVDAVIASTPNTGGYPYTAGLRWKLDLNQPKGSRFSAMEVLQADGRYVPLDMARTYSVATMNFLADGQDFYTTLATIKGERRIDVGLDYAEAFLKYVQTLPGSSKVLSKLPDAKYSTQQFIDTP